MTAGPRTEIDLAERVQELRARHSIATPSLAADLDALFAAHVPRVRSLCRRMVGAGPQSEELVQQTLLTAWERFDGFHGGARFGTWIYGIARNHCLNALRKTGDHLTSDGMIDPSDERSMSAWSQLRQRERTQLLRAAAAASLTEEEQEIVHLRYVEEAPLERIDAILGLRGSGARGVLQRIKRKLGKELRARLEALGHGESFLGDD